MRKLSVDVGSRVLGEYGQFLHEIRVRLEVCGATFNVLADGKSVNKYRQFDVEFCFLQLRKVAELMMFGSLLLQSTTVPSFNKKMMEEYHAGKILSFVRKNNPDFFPKPVAVMGDVESGLRLEGRMSSVAKPIMTEEEFLSVYNRELSPFLHADRKFGQTHEETEAYGMKIFEINRKLMALLEEHTVQLSDGDMIWAVLVGNEGGKPQVQFFKRVS